MTPRELVASYFERKFDPIFWTPHGTGQDRKHPFDPGWEGNTYTLADYHEGQQVGIRLGTEVDGRYLVDADIDVDDPGLQQLALELLPATNFVFGHLGKPASHCFYYVSEPLANYAFRFLNKTYLELRANKKDGTIGLQTMVPPSMWESKDGKTRAPLEFYVDRGRVKDGEPIFYPTSINFREHIALAAVAMLLTEYFGKYGFGHDTRMAWAGYLLGLGVSVKDLVIMGVVISKYTHNLEVDDVERVVRTTQERLTAKLPIRGRGEVARLLGPRGKDIVRTIERWLGVEDPAIDKIEKLNEKYAIIGVGNKTVVMERQVDGSIINLWPFEEFRRVLVKEKIVTAKGKVVGLADTWLHHRDGLQYRQLVYDMPGSPIKAHPDDYNGWLGFTVVPKAGDWSRNRAHIQTIICGGNEKHFAWLLNWMAALVQCPGQHAFTAVVLRGGEGVGKGHFAHLMLGALFHPQQYLHILGAGMLTGRFNEHLSGKVLVYADESTWGGDPLAADKLKGMITEGTIPIERKFLPLIEEPSMLHILIASNNEWPISIPMDDRRFAVFDVLDIQRQRDEYFGPLREELASGGLAAMLADLQAWVVDDRALRHPPATAAKRDVMLQSMKPIQRWWYEKLTSGSLFEVVDDEPDWPVAVTKKLLHEDYLGFLAKHHDSRARRQTETELGQFLNKYTPMESSRRLFGGEARQHCWIIPPLVECRTFWAAACNWDEDFEW